MGRTERHNADYFPFICNEGQTMKYIEQTYGNDGFSVWVKILRAMTTTDYHFINLSSRTRLMVFAATCRVTEEMLLKVINDLVDLDEFDRQLWENDQIIWSDKFIESIQDAYKNRKNKIVKREEFIMNCERIAGKKFISTTITSVRNTQSKEEKSIVENSKEDESKEIDSLISSNGFNYELKEEKQVPREANDLADKILDYFSASKDVMSPIYSKVENFIAMLFHRGEFEKLKISFEKYQAYKARSQEPIHGIEKWMGTIDSYFQNGKWTEINWELKLKNHERESPKGTNGSTGAKVTTDGNDYAAGLRKR
jgi:hypothetical protein